MQTGDVGLLVPADFSLRALANDEERDVVEALRDRLSDNWVVMPDVALVRDHRDHQVDLVLAHPGEGSRVQLRRALVGFGLVAPVSVAARLGLDRTPAVRGSR